jgi:hypothetical protein
VDYDERSATGYLPHTSKCPKSGRALSKIAGLFSRRVVRCGAFGMSAVCAVAFWFGHESLGAFGAPTRRHCGGDSATLLTASRASSWALKALAYSRAHLEAATAHLVWRPCPSPRCAPSRDARSRDRKPCHRQRNMLRVKGY